MASLPYISAAGNLDKALTAIKSATVPDRVSQDFVKTILKIPGGSGDQMTTYLKKIGFAGPDGKPTELYTKFRNPTTSGQSVAKALRHAYAPLYVRNEFMHNLQDDELLGLIVEETGHAPDSTAVKRTFACIKALVTYAVFDDGVDEEVVDDNAQAENSNSTQRLPTNPLPPQAAAGIGLNLGYTINLNLPVSSDPAVFNAIFKSLKEHLLRDDDA